MIFTIKTSQLVSFITKLLLQRIAINISPVEEHDHIRRTKEVTRFKARHWLYV